MSEELRDSIKKYKLDSKLAALLEQLEILFITTRDEKIHTDITMMELIKVTTKDFQDTNRNLTEKEQFLFCVGIVFREVALRVKRI